MLAIVGKDDFPLYKLNIGEHGDSDSSHMDEFVIHSSLDFVETKMLKTNQVYLKEVDTHLSSTVYCYLTAANVKILLLIDSKGDDSSKNVFFSELHDLYVKTIMNPFYEPNTKINFPAFDSRVKELTKKYFSSLY
ncbi:unnamed protein product [Moneuplotes crassus]|uniref:Trafficking protein particle complex subunit n=1 Tax=Euplotes crassus TaxID=5936 RepID=A0AAD1Y4K1_EUPCR|nr:unnamed protein product [Moneuplotes crassus]